jgi:DNA segregation ATPase FtsK/SpoIIIE-like protein
VNWADRDPLLKDAAKVIFEHQNASASFLQRKLSLGYARSARILDELNILGIVGPGNGSTPRQILITDASQIDELTKPRKLTDDEIQEKLVELDMKVNKILNAFQDISLHLAKYDEDDDEDKDALFEEAAKLAKEKKGKLTASDVQRMFNIGYARAARVIDELKEEGVINN